MEEEGAVNNDGGGGGGNARQSSNAAMNLFEKYSSLNRGIDETREEMKQARLIIEEINQNIEKAQQERDAMERDTAIAYTEANDFHQQVDEAYEELSKLQAERSRVLMVKQQADRELQGVKSFVEEHRRQFLEQSREFRASCKRVRLRATDLGLDYAPLRAFATVISDPSIAGEWNTNDEGAGSPQSVLPKIFQDDETGFHRPATIPEEQNSTGGDDGDDDASVIDPTKWIPDPRDDEMKEQLERYRKEHQLHENEKQSLENLKAQNMKVKERATSRAQRKEKSVSQLHRIQTENTNLESQISELEQLILEAKQMSQSYEKNVKSMRNKIAQRRFEEGLTSTSGTQPHQANARPTNHQRLTQNPYAKKPQNGNRSKGGSDKRTNTKSNNSATRNTSSVQARPRQQETQRQSYHKNQQHPHRVGRVRVDRQFSTNLEILAGDETLDEVDQDEPAYRGAENTIRQSISLLEDSDDDDALLANPF